MAHSSRRPARRRFGGFVHRGECAISYFHTIRDATVLIPAGGFLSTAARAQRLAANAVVAELSAVEDLWEILKKAAGGPESSPEGQA
jgi:hypothetical protein